MTSDAQKTYAANSDPDKIWKAGIEFVFEVASHKNLTAQLNVDAEMKNDEKSTARQRLLSPCEMTKPNMMRHCSRSQAETKEKKKIDGSVTQG